MQEQVDVSFLTVFLGHRTIERILCGYGKSKTMNKILTFLLGLLRGITVQASGNVFKVRFPFAIISQP